MRDADNNAPMQRRRSKELLGVKIEPITVRINMGILRSRVLSRKIPAASSKCALTCGPGRPVSYVSECK